MQKVVPSLWFNHNAEDAVKYYISVFPDSKILSKQYYPKSEAEGLAEFQKDLAGEVLTIEFEVLGMHFTAINAGPEFKFTEAVSFVISCADQKEIDYYWKMLSSDPKFDQCGWCKDKFGLSWQVVPHNMEELMARPGAFAKLMKMKKIIIEKF